MKPFNWWKKLKEELICLLALLNIVILDNLFIKHSIHHPSPSNRRKSQPLLAGGEEMCCEHIVLWCGVLACSQLYSLHWEFIRIINNVALGVNIAVDVLGTVVWWSVQPYSHCTGEGGGRCPPLSLLVPSSQERSNHDSWVSLPPAVLPGSRNLGRASQSGNTLSGP